MNSFYSNFKAGYGPGTNYVIVGEKIRITPITPNLIRYEYSENNVFCDYPTQTVVNRYLSDAACVVRNNSGIITAETDAVIITFKKNTPVRVYFKKTERVSAYLRNSNLKGTTRTLDMSTGKVRLDDGILSKCGAAVLNDKDSYLILQDDSVKSRKAVLGFSKNDCDFYIFAYDREYFAAIRDYYSLTGYPPLLPRYAFGNWWSRYYSYTQEEYLALMKKFDDKNIPFSVSVIDMDWHYTDVYPKFGKAALDYYKPKNLISYFSGCFGIPGWTGFSWNTELFPDHSEFLNELHAADKKVSLNLHPAQGIRYFESGYKDFCNYLGLDPDKKETIRFDFNDEKFRYGYFEYILKPLEKEGVDFWWIDWQQGKSCGNEKIDPLWLLNHFHCLDFSKSDKRPMILSRYAGPGSHRYPVGFSGDSAINWSTLRFQSYFTSTASNIGYSWWSHDIGGHHFGKRDGELYTRWVQLGAFSPILRLHSSKNDYLGKEPWKYDKTTELITSEYLRLRQKLIPYVYSMNYRTAFLGEPLIKPVYYYNSENKYAYDVDNEFYFGSELLVASISERCCKRTKLAKARVFLPEGEYTDLFTGYKYLGEKYINMYRSIWSLPVLAKSGAIIPMNPDNYSGWRIPEELDIHVFCGNGSFTLYEDDGESNDFLNGVYSLSRFEVSFADNLLEFSAFPSEGDVSVIPFNRSYNILFRDIVSCTGVCFYVDDTKYEAAYLLNEYLIVKNIIFSADKGFKLQIMNPEKKKNDSKDTLINNFLSSVEGFNSFKSVKFSGKSKKIPENRFNKEWLFGPINEINNLL